MIETQSLTPPLMPGGANLVPRLHVDAGKKIWTSGQCEHGGVAMLGIINTLMTAITERR